MLSLTLELFAAISDWSAGKASLTHVVSTLCELGERKQLHVHTRNTCRPAKEVACTGKYYKCFKRHYSSFCTKFIKWKFPFGFLYFGCIDERKYTFGNFTFLGILKAKKVYLWPSVSKKQQTLWKALCNKGYLKSIQHRWAK